MDGLCATVAGMAATLSIIGFTLAYTVAPDAINMGVGCALAAAIIAAAGIALRQTVRSLDSDQHHQLPAPKPYGDMLACWDCGTPLDAQPYDSPFRHPLHRRRRVCPPCAELEELKNAPKLT
jgi:hypothetical protein